MNYIVLETIFHVAFILVGFGLGFIFKLIVDIKKNPSDYTRQGKQKKELYR